MRLRIFIQKGGKRNNMVKGKSKYAITYLPSKDGFAVNKMTKGEVIKKKYRKNTSYVRASSPKQALSILSKRSYRAETGRRLRK